MICRRKYRENGENGVLEGATGETGNRNMAATDFLFDFVYIMGSVSKMAFCIRAFYHWAIVKVF